MYNFYLELKKIIKKKAYLATLEEAIKKVKVIYFEREREWQGTKPLLP